MEEVLRVLGALVLEPDAGLAFDPEASLFACTYCEQVGIGIKDLVHEAVCPIKVGRDLYHMEMLQRDHTDCYPRLIG